MAEAHVRAMSLGATLLQAANDPATDGEVFQVYADPAGHPFCLCRGPLPE
ncbi:MAG: VOC family protein [Nocardioidaceae bacterium]